MTSPPNDYPVGYGKPPKHSQFKKGQSGKPRGHRMRYPKKMKTILNEVLNRKVRIREADTFRRVTIRELMITQLAAKATKGHMAALNLLLELKEDVKSRGELPGLEIRFIPDEQMAKRSRRRDQKHDGNGRPL
jgi:hypothetical protein